MRVRAACVLVSLTRSKILGIGARVTVKTKHEIAAKYNQQDRIGGAA